jgi:ATP-dependent RNA helicase DDX24/MAK5
LILAPTRELALQISSHLNSCLCSVDVKVEEADSVVSLKTLLKKEDRNGNGQTQPIPKSSKSFPVVSIAAVVGGLSAQKQRRILGRGVDVLVATPGRLWDILQEAS